MPVTYTNRKGTTYTLCKSTTRNGKLRYNFTRQPRGEAVETIPDGYLIVESVNGIVSLAKVKAKLITDEELATVEEALAAHSQRHNYKVNRKDNRLDIYEGVGPDWVELAEDLGAILGIGSLSAQAGTQLQDRMADRRQYTAVMRFTLQDPVRRLFNAERMCYLGSIDDWILVRFSEPIDKLARRLIPTLGTDEFYELY